MKCIVNKILGAIVVFSMFVGCGLLDMTMASDMKEGSAKIYFQNSQAWEKVYAWAWTMKYNDQLVANPWPGDEMCDVGNGWMMYEIDAPEEYAILFNDGAGNQTADATALVPGASYWMTLSQGEEQNDTGIGGGTNVITYTEPQAGFPEGPEATTNDQLQENTTQTTSKGNVGIVIGMVIGVIVIVGIGAAVIKRK